MALVTGNTYPVKDKLLELGGKWKAGLKGWEVPDDKLQEALKLVAEAPKGVDAKKPYYPTVCTSCGCRASRYTKIYRSGICSNCYRDQREEQEMGY